MSCQTTSSPPSPSRGQKRKHANDEMDPHAEAMNDRTSLERERQTIWGLSMMKLSKYQSNGYQQLRRAVLVWQTMRTVFQSCQETEQKAAAAAAIESSKEETEKETIATDLEAENAARVVSNADVDVYMETGRRGAEGNAVAAAAAAAVDPETARQDDEAPDLDDGSTETCESASIVVANQNKRVCCMRLERGSRSSRRCRTSPTNENEDCFDGETFVPVENDVEESEDVDDEDESDGDDSGVGDMGTSADGDEDFLTVLLERSSLSQNAGGVVCTACSLEASSSTGSANSTSSCLTMKVLEN